MKYWGLLVAFLYVAVLVAVLLPLLVWLLPFDQAGMTWWQELLDRARGLFALDQDGLSVWIYAGLMLVAQAAFLSVPVDMAQKRPTAKKTIIPLVVATSLMMGLLGAGVALAVNETLAKGGAGFINDLLMWGVFVLMWVFWAVVFYRWSRGAEPKDFIARQCRVLLRGSILELLIAVPAHIWARHKDYCCAGAQTFLGIAFGVSVMLFSFGPGIFFLLVERLKYLRKAGA